MFSSGLQFHGLWVLRQIQAGAHHSPATGLCPGKAFKPTGLELGVALRVLCIREHRGLVQETQSLWAAAAIGASRDTARRTF